MATEPPFEHNVLRARFDSARGAGRARIRELTPTGRLVVNAREAFLPGDRLRVRLRLAEGAHDLLGVVETSEPTLFVARLEVDPTDRAWIDRLRVRAAAGESLSEAEISGLEPTAPVEATAPAPDPGDLARRWQELSRRLDDAEGHASFIGDCARASRLDLAVACYRQLVAAHPDDPRPERYLKQVATVMSFQMAPTSSTPEGLAGSKRIRILLWVFVAAAAILAAVAAATAWG